MTDQGQLLAHVIHEINNPLAYAMSNLQLLSDYRVTLKRILIEYQALVELVRAGHEGRKEEVDAILAQIGASREQDKLSDIIQDLDQLVLDSSKGLQRIKELIQTVKSSVDDETA